MSETEQLQSKIKEQEYKYTEALENHQSYSILKRIKERIRELKGTLEILRFHTDDPKIISILSESEKIIKEIFSEKFNNIIFEFKRLVLNANEVGYEIVFNNNGNKDSFKMYKDVEGMWRIVANILPVWIKETEQELSEIIRNNENQYHHN
jgi:hypothetical protein